MPADAYYGAQTQRAVENFPISGLTAPAGLVVATVQIKKAAADANGAARPAAAEDRQGHRRGGRRSPRRPAARTVRGRHLPGRRRHVAQHERERGAGQPGGGDARRRPRRVHAASTRTITSTWGSRRTTCSRRRRGSRSLRDGRAAGRGSARPCRCARRQERRRSRTMLKTGRTHLQDAVPITLGQEFGGFAANVRHAADEVEPHLRAAARAESRRDGRRHRAQRRRRLHPRGRRPPGRVHRRAVPPGGQSIPRHAEHGGRARVFGGASAAGGGGREGRIGSAAAQHGAARRHRRNPAAAGAAGIVDHARQGESIGARDGQPGVLPGDRLRRGDPRRGRCRPARTERDDAGHRVERAPRDARS